LECGDSVRDEAAVDVLSAELKVLEGKLQLPPLSPGDSQLQAPLPLRVAFSLVRVTRHDPAEAFFVRLLLHDGPSFRTKPIVFPVFGRGRALPALAGRHLNEQSITQACAFILGPCAREAKESNPGKDLLLAAKWNSIFQKPAVPEGGPALPASGNPSALVPDSKPAASAPPAVRDATAPRGLSPIIQRLGVVATIVLVLGFLLRHFPRKPRP